MLFIDETDTMAATSSSVVCTPLRVISSRVMVVTGSAPSTSMRLIAEPVISTR